MTALVWRRSTWCAAGDCLEIAESDHPGLAHIRSVNGAFVLWTHTIPRGELAAFLKAARKGQFKDLEDTP